MFDLSLALIMVSVFGLYLVSIWCHIKILARSGNVLTAKFRRMISDEFIFVTLDFGGICLESIKYSYLILHTNTINIFDTLSMLNSNKPLFS